MTESLPIIFSTGRDSFLYEGRNTIIVNNKFLQREVEDLFPNSSWGSSASVVNSSNWFPRLPVEVVYMDTDRKLVVTSDGLVRLYSTGMDSSRVDFSSILERKQPLDLPFPVKNARILGTHSERVEFGSVIEDVTRPTNEKSDRFGRRHFVIQDFNDELWYFFIIFSVRYSDEFNVFQSEPEKLGIKAKQLECIRSWSYLDYGDLNSEVDLRAFIFLDFDGKLFLYEFSPQPPEQSMLLERPTLREQPLNVRLEKIEISTNNISEGVLIAFDDQGTKMLFGLPVKPWQLTETEFPCISLPGPTLVRSCYLTTYTDIKLMGQGSYIDLYLLNDGSFYGQNSDGITRKVNLPQLSPKDIVDLKHATKLDAGRFKRSDAFFLEDINGSVWYLIIPSLEFEKLFLLQISHNHTISLRPQLRNASRTKSARS